MPAFTNRQLITILEARGVTAAALRALQGEELGLLNEAMRSSDAAVRVLRGCGGVDAGMAQARHARAHTDAASPATALLPSLELHAYGSPTLSYAGLSPSILSSSQYRIA